MTALQPYPGYKDSGVEWLGEVPEHWEVRRLKGLLEILNGATPTSGKSEYWNGHILWITPDDLGRLPGRYICSSRRRITRAGYRSCGTTLAPVGSTVVSTRAPIGHLAILGRNGCANQGCRLLVPKRNALIPEWTYFGLLAARRELQVLGQGTTFAELARGALGTFGLPLPPLPEQTVIARFLDDADRRIRGYIRAKERLIELLDEQKQAIIHEAVTGQIDVRTGQPYPAFKDSGEEWLGEVPEHWEVRTFTRNCVEISDYRGATPKKTDSGVFLVTAKNIRRGWIDYDASQEFVAKEEYGRIMRRGLPRVGDLLITTEAPLGFAALVDRADIALAQRVIRFRLDQKVLLPEFGLRSVLDTYFQNQLQCRGTGSTALGIKGSKLPLLKIICPPINEQAAILKHIQTACRKCDGESSTSARLIDLLEEYRTRLIADVVTGKIDVREAAARLPEVDPIARHNRVDATHTESHSHATEHDMAKEAIP